MSEGTLFVFSGFRAFRLARHITNHDVTPTRFLFALLWSPCFGGQRKRSLFLSPFEAECTKIAHRRSLAIFAADSGIAGNSAVGIKSVPFNRRENRRLLAIFFAEEIAHLGALKIARFCGGAVKIAAATAENRAILVHSALKSNHPFWGRARGDVSCFQRL